MKNDEDQHCNSSIKIFFFLDTLVIDLLTKSIKCICVSASQKNVLRLRPFALIEN